ncbi:MAG: aldo/keto reductase [Meiothermus sp.]|uniref:aldo/keto reductase n=1 Tax=Meiothermus sp. TaxID=1955249 RepID=UPI0025E68BAA|nr:aldo/keto reductase [Meiothermus sp.]MCS7058797.1 aldo/keto reductase [Meiothermus sp.]MCS7195416.1 aldo/keto reductase [Meiothermus sp.]MDW8092040.1 aldo/keto reductase [Meiothermus sp.]MDW8482274.1 aldo/keto reductase [Meiothermus sp.]
MEAIQIPGLPPVPPLGLGTWQWGDRLIWGYGGGYREEDVRLAYRAALKGGVRLFDSAEVYGFGLSERLLGECYRAYEPKPLLVSKFFPYPWRFSRRALLSALRGSLARLGLPRLDLYLLHWPWKPVPLEQWAESLAEAYEQGLARAVGVSNCNLGQLERVAGVLSRHRVPLAANQVEYHLLERGPERSGLLGAMRAEGVVLMAYSPLAMGWLTGKYSLEKPPPGRYRAQRYARHKARIPHLLHTLRAIAQKHGATPAQVALRWCIEQGTLPIPGAKSALQAEANAGALRFRLDAEDRARLEEAAPLEGA